MGSPGWDLPPGAYAVCPEPSPLQPNHQTQPEVLAWPESTHFLYQKVEYTVRQAQAYTPLGTGTVTLWPGCGYYNSFYPAALGSAQNASSSPTQDPQPSSNQTIQQPEDLTLALKGLQDPPLSLPCPF